MALGLLAHQVGDGAMYSSWDATGTGSVPRHSLPVPTWIPGDSSGASTAHGSSIGTGSGSGSGIGAGAAMARVFTGYNLNLKHDGLGTPQSPLALPLPVGFQSGMGGSGSSGSGPTGSHGHHGLPGSLPFSSGGFGFPGVLPPWAPGGSPAGIAMMTPGSVSPGPGGSNGVGASSGWLPPGLAAWQWAASDPPPASAYRHTSLAGSGSYSGTQEHGPRAGLGPHASPGLAAASVSVVTAWPGGPAEVARAPPVVTARGHDGGGFQAAAPVGQPLRRDAKKGVLPVDRPLTGHNVAASENARSGRTAATGAHREGATQAGIILSVPASDQLELEPSGKRARGAFKPELEPEPASESGGAQARAHLVGFSAHEPEVPIAIPPGMLFGLRSGPPMQVRHPKFHVNFKLQLTKYYECPRACAPSPGPVCH